MSDTQPSAEQKIVNGSNWFYWIAGLTAVNTVAALTGGDWSFIIGLGITQVIDAVVLALGAEAGDAARVIAGLLDLVILAIVVAFGVFARRSKWVYLTGMLLFALDTVIFVVVADWVGVGFHALVLFFMWPGFMAFAERGTFVPAVDPAETSLAAAGLAQPQPYGAPDAGMPATVDDERSF